MVAALFNTNRKINLFTFTLPPASKRIGMHEVFESDSYYKNALNICLNYIKKYEKRNNREFEYVYVCERQARRGAIHFHMVTPSYVDIKYLNDLWCKTIASAHNKSKNAVDILTGLKSPFYLSKYISKDNSTFFTRIVGSSRNISRLSKGFVTDYKTAYGDYMEQLDFGDFSIQQKDVDKSIWIEEWKSLY